MSGRRVVPLRDHVLMVRHAHWIGIGRRVGPEPSALGVGRNERMERTKHDSLPSTGRAGIRIGEEARHLPATCHRQA
jgi:hypothetical protein